MKREALVAITVLSASLVLTCGIRQSTMFMRQEWHQHSIHEINLVAQGMDQYFAKHKKYPALMDFASMVDANSPLIKEQLVSPGIKLTDHWGQPYNGLASEKGYRLQYAGNQKHLDECPPFVVEKGQP